MPFLAVIYLYHDGRGATLRHTPANGHEWLGLSDCFWIVPGTEED